MRKAAAAHRVGIGFADCALVAGGERRCNRARAAVKTAVDMRGQALPERAFALARLYEKHRAKRGSGRADAVSVFTYGGAKASTWWKKSADVIARTPRVAVWRIEPAQSAALARLASRNMTLDVTLADGTAWFGDGRQQVEIQPEPLTMASAPPAGYRPSS